MLFIFFASELILQRLVHLIHILSTGLEGWRVGGLEGWRFGGLEVVRWFSFAYNLDMFKI